MDGASILRRACTTCHDLGGLSAYAGYWGEPEWRSMVETMLSYGAQLTPGEVAVLSRYLAVAYGTGGGSEGESTAPLPSAVQRPVTIPVVVRHEVRHAQSVGTISALALDPELGAGR